MNSEMYVTANDCYGSGARATLSLTLSRSLSLSISLSLRWGAEEGLEGFDIQIKLSKTAELWRTQWQLMTADFSFHVSKILSRRSMVVHVGEYKIQQSR